MTPCVLWTGVVNAKGYGHISEHGRQRRVHRVVYERAFGPIPEGLSIDHTCHNADLTCAGGNGCPHRRCINPEHLEAVDPRVNVLRGRPNPASRHAAQTHCLRGHALEAARIEWKKGRPTRRCRICRAAYQHEYMKHYRKNAA